MIKHALTCIDCLTRRISTITRPGALHYQATAASTTVLPIPFASTETHLADHALMSRTNGKPSVVTSGGCEGDGQLFLLLSATSSRANQTKDLTVLLAPQSPNSSALEKDTVEKKQ